MKHYFLILLSLNTVVVLLLFYHEKILNMIDTITMPINDELCQRTKLSIGMTHLSLSNLSVASIQSRLGDLDLSYGGVHIPAAASHNIPLLLNKLKATRKPTRVAVIVPYRDRSRNLHIFLYYMHLFLAQQDIYYGIYLVEPAEGLKFNRAMLLNIGFVESLYENEWDCFIFHDVDLLPENPRNVYTCDTNAPKQMAISISKFNYIVNSYFKDRYFGGVNAFTKEQYIRINGFSNLYFEWGLEDDDARLRTLNEYPTITRLEPQIGRYFANCHPEQPRNPNRFLLYIGSRMDKSGLDSLSYNLVKKEKTFLYTRLYVTYRDNYDSAEQGASSVV